MIEVYPQTGVYWSRRQRDKVFFNSKGPEQAISRAVDVFFTKDELRTSSARGIGKYNALDQNILNACICK